MPWNEVNTVILGSEFVRLARNEGTTSVELYERFRISRETGYNGLLASGPKATLVSAARAADQLPPPVGLEAMSKLRCSDCMTSTPCGEVENCSGRDWWC